MTMPDTDKLTPYERASARIQASSRQDDAAVLALQPPTVLDALHDTKTSLAFALLAFTATAESLRAQGAVCSGRLALAGEKDAEEKANEAEVAQFLTLMGEAERQQFAWILALAVLDIETGGACIPLVDAFANGHAVRTLEAARGYNIPFDQELEYLRDMRERLTHTIPGAPQVGEAILARLPAATETWQ